MRLRTVMLGTASAAAALALVAGRGRDPGRIQSEDIRAVTSEGAGSLAAHPLAGVSARGAVNVESLHRRRFRRDTSAAYHHLRHRCFSCHALPDPRLHAASEWPAIVARIDRNLAAAGLYRLTADEQRKIAGFLMRHADAR